jgi:D-alanyl-D-alanine carboxypeptidase (penicillin-binding protein 5/6)
MNKAKQYLKSMAVILILIGMVACQTSAVQSNQYSNAQSYATGDSAGGYTPASYQPLTQGGSVLPAPTQLSEYSSSSRPAIRAESYLLVDAQTGQVLASQAADVRRGVASTQKLLTALVVLQSGQLDQKITIHESDGRVEPTKLGLKAGEVYSRRHLLYCLLIKSANDVARALARDNAGSVEAFTVKMNQMAQQLGCRQSRFVNPHGLTEAGQYSTARDMALIARAAYLNPVVRDAAKRSYYSFRNNAGSVITLKATNELLGRMSECTGLKTGYTVAAGRCLISSAQKRGKAVILVQLGTKTKYIWDDARLLMGWGLNQ